MIELYTWGTPNGRKVSIMLEEVGLDYTVHPINIMKDEQFAPEFLKLSPNNRIPAVRDTETGTELMESGAILMYLANKTGKLLAPDGPDYWQAIEWLMWQMGGFGPMLGQAHHFLKFNPGISDYAEKRYGNETRRLYGVLDGHLAKQTYVARDYSIADIAIWPWASRFEWQQIDLNDYPNVKRWYTEIATRPAVQRGYKIPSDTGDIPMP